MKVEARIKEIFAQALERKSPAERENYLAEVCQGDPELRRELESLLRAGEQAGEFLGKTLPLPQPDFTVERTGTMIGRYKLLEKIGEGGFGTVYMAEQVEPVQRKVAIKIIKAGMDTREVVARFEAERQALALMDHPNIARVLDAGATEAGRPYFVMELVRGITITDYCDQKNLSTTERLRLFMKVCHAVQHAHQKGIIHRDIKPNNVLVTLHDGEPVPKVIDFGVAKALGQKLTEKTLFTGFQQMIGTPAYMSPEQAELSGLDIDTRSDIYSLGVLLYELLTGVTPFDAETLRKAAWDEIRRMIRETEPPKPSTRLHTLGDKLDGVARQRHTEPKALWRLVHGDLDWIVMKALEKDRQRRYETPDAFASDVARHLSNEPVLASPPSLPYLGAKFVRRHKAGLATATALMLLLTAGAVVGTWQAVRATRAERTQSSLRQQAEDARAQETLQKQKATAKAQESLDRLVRLQNANGIGLMDEDDLAASLPWFAEALSMEQGQAEREDLQRIRINSVLQACPKPVQIWFHGGPVTSAHFSRDGRLVVTASRDHTAQIWDTSTGKPVGSVLQHTGIVWQAIFSPDSRRVVTASEDGTARVWDADTGQPIARPLPHRGPVVSAVFSPNGKMVATASEDHTAQLWDAESGEVLAAPMAHGDAVRQLAFSPDSRLLATGSEDAKVWIWQTGTGRKISPIYLAHSGPIRDLQFNAAGNHLLASSLDGTARIWSVERYNYYVAPVINHNGPVLHSSFSPSGRNIVTACGTGAAQIYEIPSGQPKGPELLHRGAVHWAEFDAEGRRVVTASADHTASVWEASTGQMAVRLRHGGVVRMAEFSPDGRFVLTASDDCTARIWLLPEGPALYRRVEDEPPVWHSIVGPDGATKIMRDERQTEVAAIGEAIPGGSPGRRIQHAATIRGAVFSPDGRWVATASDDQTARVWSVGTGQPVSPPMEHQAPVWCVAFSPDGLLLATATAECSIRVWAAASGEPVTPNYRLDGPITNLGFSPDGRDLVASSGGGLAQGWNLTPAKLSAQDLSGLAELLAGRRLDDTKTSLEPSSALALSNLWESVGKKYLSGFVVSTAARRPVAEPSFPRPQSTSAQGVQGGERPTASEVAKTPGPAQRASSLAQIPDRDPRTGRNQLDLTRFYNAALTQGWHTPEDEKATGNSLSDLSELPRGLVELGGVSFDVRGIVQVSGQSLRAQGGRYPEQIKGIPVSRKCMHIQFLHGTGWSTTEGAEIGAYVIHYANGQRRVLPIIYGEDVRDWFFFDSLPVISPHARVVWTGDNPATRSNGRAHLQLYLRTWANPTPDIEITSIDLISAMTPCAPFLIAITVNDISTEQDPASPKPINSQK